VTHAASRAARRRGTIVQTAAAAAADALPLPAQSPAAHLMPAAGN